MGAEAIILGHRVVDEPKAAHRSMAMWCTIRTFAKHAIELGNQPVADPIFFVKPDGCLHESGPLPVSAHPGEVHHEVECVVKLDEARRPVAIAVGLDLTDRATQGELRAEQLPWAKAKCFRSSAVIGPFVPWEGTWDDLLDPARGLHLDLSVNGTLRQSAPLHEMSVTPRQQIDSLHRWAPVNRGDVLFTGTPAGVGLLLPGDKVVARLLQVNGETLSEIDVGCV
jgi:fumarylpyruvate hydrolase